ncbi:hypothetical protein HZS_3754, partial [Henneguya salminicola]
MQVVQFDTYDLVELKRLSQLANRERVQIFLADKITEIESVIGKQEPSTVQKTPKKIIKTLKGYSWEQTTTGLKFYIPVPESFEPEQIETNFSRTGFSLIVNLDQINYELKFKQLFAEIVPDKFTIKTKDKLIILSVTKEKAEQWECVSASKKKPKEKMPKLDEKNTDPGAGLMNMLKKMHDDGDDEMKRTIEKAWTESRDKQRKG